MGKRRCIYAGQRFRVIRQEKIGGAAFLIIEDEPGHEDRILRASAEHPTDGSPCFCSWRRVVVHRAGKEGGAWTE